VQRLADPSLPESDGPTLTAEQAKRKRRECWAGLQEMYWAGKCRAIGVSNFGIVRRSLSVWLWPGVALTDVHVQNHLEDLFSWEGLTVQPMVNQVQLHARLSQQPLVDYCHGKNMVVTAFCPLSGSDLDAPTLVELAQKHGVSPANVVLRWLMQRGIAAIPKTHTISRLGENLKVRGDISPAPAPAPAPVVQVGLCLNKSCPERRGRSAGL